MNVSFILDQTKNTVINHALLTLLWGTEGHFKIKLTLPLMESKYISYRE